ncbi:YdcF family protein [Alkaliphilus metalliredigens]|uniref:YdcF family protein n=1 Tax=Alkaliphilus metalliredigens TaxID=208226 RepID=UPI00059FF192|nr:YdcF family protein [Alkaliphilus metalliredigens]
MNKTIRYILGVLFIWVAVHVLITTFDGLNDKTEIADAAVVLGNKVELDGTPSPRLQGRLDKAVELYEKGYFNYVIVSGGTGKEGFDEALVMKDYLVKNEIPDDKVILDQEGYNSMMTAKNTKIIMDHMDLESVTVISQFYHITRTKLAFRKVGFEQVYSAHAEYFDFRDIYSIAREFAGYYKYLFMKV